MTVKLDEYLDKLVDMCNIKISCMAQVLETKQFYCDSDDFRLAKPELIIKVSRRSSIQTQSCRSAPPPRRDDVGVGAIFFFLASDFSNPNLYLSI